MSNLFHMQETGLPISFLLFWSFIIQAKMPQILWSNPLYCEDFILFFVTHTSKLNIFPFLTVVWVEQDIQILHFEVEGNFYTT